MEMINHRINRRLQVIVVFLAAFVLSFAASALAIDPPHDSVANCASCHSAAGLYNAGIGASIDNTPQNMLCHTCHLKSGSSMSKVTHSALTTGSGEKPYVWNSTWSYECRNCHNPHHQKQARLSPGPLTNDGNRANDGAWVYTGTIDSVFANTLTDGAAPWASNNLEGYMLQPNSAFPVFYRILSSNTSGVTVLKDIKNTNGYAAVGGTYAITYGMMVKRKINRMRPITNTSGYVYNSNLYAITTLFDNTGDHSQAPTGAATDASTTALCVVCHTRTKYNNIGYAVYNQAFDETINPDYEDANVGNNLHLDPQFTSDTNTCWDESLTGCHKPPKEGFDEKAACGECHGNPMKVATDLVKKIKIAGDVKNSTTGTMANIGAHNTHNDANIQASKTLDCAKCHETGMVEVDDKADTIGNYKIEIQFGIPGHQSGKYSGRTSMTSTGVDDSGTMYYYNSPLGHLATNDNTMTCSNVWCHDPTPIANGIVNQPTWTQGPSAGVCGACHRVADSTTTMLGKHEKHVANTGSGMSNMMDPLDCTACHPHDGAIPLASHVTSYIDIVMTSYSGAEYNGVSTQSNNTVTAEGSYNNCTNLYCHSNADPVTEGGPTYQTVDWDQSGDSMTCQSCHRDASGGSAEWSFPHYAHTNTSTYGFICKDCHYDVTSDNGTVIDNSLHIDGTKDVVINSEWGALTDWNGGTYTCANITCHSTGRRVDTGLTNFVDASWNVGSTSCGTCHRTNDTEANMLSTPIQNMSLVHVKHVANDLYDYGCEKCHSDTVSSSTVISDYSKHTDGANQVAMSSGTHSQADNQCSNVDCHGDGAGNAGITTPDWTDKATGQCGDCHNVDDANPPTTSAHTAHVGTAEGYKYECYKCHKDIVDDTADSTVVGNITDFSLHVNLANDVVFDTADAGPDSDFTTPDCSNIYCHSNADPSAWGGGRSYGYTDLSWYDTVSGCDACHNKQNDTIANWSSAHDIHVGGGSDEYGARFDCNACHSDVASSGTKIITNSLHVDGKKDVAINSTYGDSADWTTPNCANVNCHSTGRGTHNTVGWGETLDCKGCHQMADTKANMYALAPIQNLSPAHIRHIGNGTDEYGDYGLRNVTAIMCDNCHLDTTDDNATINGTGMSTEHVDFTNDVVFNLGDFMERLR
jgi:predicted CxxxxCH...CXXCH cytochrome family protein